MKNYILKYNQINESNNFEDLSFEEVERLVELGLIDEDLLKIYYYIKNGSTGELDLYESVLQYLPTWLTKVNGELTISKSSISDIPDTLEITGSIYASDSNLKEFRRTEVSRSLALDYTKVTKLPINLKVHGYLSVEGIQFEEIPKNLEIDGTFYIRHSNLEQFTDEELHKMYKIGAIIRP